MPDEMLQFLTPSVVAGAVGVMTFCDYMHTGVQGLGEEHEVIKEIMKSDLRCELQYMGFRDMVSARYGRSLTTFMRNLAVGRRLERA